MYLIINQYKKEIANLERRNSAIENTLRNQELQRITEKENVPIQAVLQATANSSEQSSANQALLKKFKLHETRLKRRISELETLVEQQTQNNTKLLLEKAALSNSFSKRLIEQGEINSILEQKIHSLEQELKSRTENRNNTSAEAMKLRELLEMETTKNQSLQMKLELQENSRNTMQETTMQLLKQTHIESSKMAFTHSQKSLEILREEWRREQHMNFESTLKPYRQRIRELESHISAISHAGTTNELQENREKLKTLEAEYRELNSTHEQCLERLRIAKLNAPPSSAEFDQLYSRIHELEFNARKREALIQNSLEEQRLEIRAQLEKDQNRLRAIIRNKDDQIREFQNEIDAVIHGISMLRENMLIIQ